MRGAAGERHGILADGERIAGVETDAGMRTELLDELDQLLAADVLMILDRQHQPGVADAIASPGGACRARGRSSRSSALPSERARPRAPASDGSAGSSRRRALVQRTASLSVFARRVRQPEAADRLEAVRAARAAARDPRRRAASASDDRARSSRSPSSRTMAMKPSTPSGRGLARGVPEALQAQRIGQAVGVEGEAHRSGFRVRRSGFNRVQGSIGFDGSGSEL